MSLSSGDANGNRKREAPSGMGKLNNRPPVRLIDCHVTKELNTVAISTPIPAENGQISHKTPIFHLPLYKVQLKLDQTPTIGFNCDLADMIALIDKLKNYENLWRQNGPIGNKQSQLNSSYAN